LLLETGNRVLADTVAEKIKSAEAKRDPMDVRLCDFDEVAYRVVVDKAAVNIMQVSISLPCWNEVKAAGGEDALNKHYGSMVVPAISGFDATLQVDLDNLPFPADELITKFSLLKTNLIGGVFNRPLQNLSQGGAPGEHFKFSIRNDTTVYFIPSADRVTVVFSLDFSDRVDLAVAKVFLQEFVESRRHLGSAPPCSFSVNPQLELKVFGITEPQGKLGFLSFAILKSHVDSNKLDRVVQTLQTFRNYLQYHLKCSKAHFHARMRARVRALLKVLNRAKTDQDDNAPKKTISGKTFVRKV